MRLRKRAPFSRGMLVQRDYYSIEWPITKRRYEYGTYFDGVLQCYFPPAFGVINCVI